ncbi:DUF393 domain-containing protein [filamentous cyanobacterium LEGE 11480]|uniref:DUF393 domain-containing protein n=1 Tax=Romeriopsis navalis LEGE 11480 TaxID=2777977 RepID=A0A928VM50_9CYAN|nr:DUF393 domain-containing protein [Romeriopsis navalis]MBE9031086.1 DUF393 domain-containing protein [Romeriopsis navalis LEGE 11480]
MTSVQSTVTATTTPPSWQIKLLYDGACPLCLREVNFLTKKDAGRGLVAFVDVAADDYDPAKNGGVDFATAMGVIHAVRPDGSLVKNVAVFREVYEILGMGWIYAITKLPVIGPLADWVYGIWADWRLAVTGRGSLAEVVAAREQRLADCSEEGRCRIGG